jgi:branched-chain amino acid transport system permease protein
MIAMEYFAQQAVNALALGGTYALLALGLAVVFSILGLINFAHGELMTITGYGLVFSLATGMPYVAALICGVALAVLCAVAMERVAFRPVRRASTTTMLLTSFAVSSILHTAFQNFISARPKPVPVPEWLGGAFTIAGIQIGAIPSLSILVTAVSLAGLVWFFQNRHTGLAMRAASEDFAVTRLMGINANRVIAASFAISGFLAAIAGILWLFQRGSVDPMLGFVPVLKAFIAAVLGGLGSLPGAVLGGIILGATEVMLRAYLPETLLGFRDAIALVLIIGLLILFPNGLMGRPIQAR